MVTRRTVLGTGLACATVACAAGTAAYDPTTQRFPEARSIDALLIDETIELPGQMLAFIRASRGKLPVFGIRLDAASQSALMRVLDESQLIVGISSGATLFCLERIAWDRGMRLAHRSPRCASDAGSCRNDVAAFLRGAQPPAAMPSLLNRDYRPSRADGTLHAWVMRKSLREA